MIRRSWPSILTSVPDHLPNRTRSPGFTSSGTSWPCSLRAPGPAAMISPSCGFSFAVSGMMMPPAVFSSASMRSHEHAVVQWTEMHAHPPYQFSDVISRTPENSPRAKTTLGAREIRFKRAGENFSEPNQGYPDAGGQTRRCRLIRVTPGE